MSGKRSFVTLLTAFSFVVLSATGILAFARPFSLQVVGLHALMGFVFLGLVALHLTNNLGRFSRYFRNRRAGVTLALVLGLTVLFFWQPGPIRSVLGLSANLGPALDRFELRDDGLVYRYSPAPEYKLVVEIRAGDTFDAEKAPHFAIWLENASFYHIKTLHEPQEAIPGRATLPYWDFKRRGWEEAKQKAEESGQELADRLEVDAITEPTQNSSFDPADYILPADPENPMPYRLLLEIDQPGDDQPSLVYAVDIDNLDPRTFQLLDLVGYPKREETGADGEESWSLYYIDETFTTALDLIDSALLTIERNHESE